MRYIITAIIASLLLFGLLPAFTEENPHITIVYPKDNSNISAPATFLVGNTEPKSQLTINNKPVKIYTNGGFVQVVNLNMGVNTINIQSALEGKQTSVSYNLNRVNISEISNYPVITNYKTPIWVEITKDYAVIRSTPNGDRLTPMPQGIKLQAIAKNDDSYKFKMGNRAYAWISAKDVKLLPLKKYSVKNSVSNITSTSDTDSTTIKINLSNKLPISIEQISKPQMTLIVHGVKTNPKLSDYTYNDDFINSINVSQLYDDIFKIVITPKTKQFWGYKYYYEGNTLVLKLRKPPHVDVACPLKDKTITVDPGHGGLETGAMGPTGIPEKDINLAIAEFLKTKLINAGAKVIMTRESDVDVDLYKRVDIANANNSQVLISIHNNALPDGKNPYIEHGSSTYYYYPQSLPLAESIQKSLVQCLGFKDYGIYSKSLVLTRTNEPIAVLAEVGFMIYPDEYNLLIQKDFQEKAADAIYSGLVNFYLSNAENSNKK